MGASYYKHHRDEVLVADARQRVAEILERFSERCTEVGVTFRVLEETGIPFERILFESEDLDLTMLGKQTFFHFETQSSADETLEAVLRQSHRPVVAVPLEWSASGSVVVAYDASPPSVRTLHAFQKSGIDDGEVVHVLSVASDSELAELRAGEAAQFLRFHGMDAHARPVPQTAPPAKIILQKVKELDARMLVMGAYGKSRFSEFFFGSNTRTILRESNTLLFLHR